MKAIQVMYGRTRAADEQRLMSADVFASYGLEAQAF